jgi:hypothetical protein
MHTQTNVHTLIQTHISYIHKYIHILSPTTNIILTQIYIHLNSYKHMQTYTHIHNYKYFSHTYAHIHADNS